MKRGGNENGDDPLRKLVSKIKSSEFNETDGLSLQKGPHTVSQTFKLCADSLLDSFHDKE